MGNHLVVGADHLGSIKNKLIEVGFKRIKHINGRKDSDVHMEIPQGTDAVLVLY